MDFYSISILIVLTICYIWYVSIISKKNKTREALSGVDVQLQQRSELIPNILTIAQKFLDHERELLEEITELRTRVEGSYNKSSRVEVEEHLAFAEQLTQKMGQLKIAVEAYPDLKSDRTMIQAMQTYNEVEAQIAAARRFYNAAVTALNNSVQIFPGTVIAKLAGVTDMPFYQASDDAKKPVNAADFLK